MSDFEPRLSREELIKRARILVIDDEKPLLISELEKVGFSVQYDPTGDDTSRVERQLYDLVVLDYSGVGKNHGTDQGLSLLRHIRRVAPATRVLAYTSKPLGADQSEFYRLTSGTLLKDEGITESLKCVEDELRKALQLEFIWSALLVMTGVEPDSVSEADLRKGLVKALKSRNKDAFKKALSSGLKGVAGMAIDSLVGKIFSLSENGNSTP